MKRAYRIIPCYAGDVSGAASALYELGGMVVIHDPSGCNSTYNTHDETRWYKRDSLIYISGLKRSDALMGNDKAFIRDVTEAAAELGPRFIALCSSPIPWINGTDFEALAGLIEGETGLPTFAVRTNGMHDYTRGVGRALTAYAAKMLPKVGRGDTGKSVDIKPDSPIRVVIVGLTPLDFPDPATVEDLKARLEAEGFSVIASWAMGTGPQELLRTPMADVSLVVSAGGLEIARYLEKIYGIPYVAGLPVGDFSSFLFETLRKKGEESRKKKQAGVGLSRETLTQSLTAYGQCLAQDLTEEEMAEKAEASGLVIAAEPVLAGSLKAAIFRKDGLLAKVLLPLEESKSLLLPGDCVTEGEEDMEKAFSKARYIIGDPLYRPICPGEADFYPLPHQAFSGRMFKGERKDPLTLEI